PVAGPAGRAGAPVGGHAGAGGRRATRPGAGRGRGPFDREVLPRGACPVAGTSSPSGRPGGVGGRRGGPPTPDRKGRGPLRAYWRMNKPYQLNTCRAARVPARGLAALAPLRAKGGVHVVMDRATAWVTWDGDARDLLDTLLTLPGDGGVWAS